MIRSSFWIVACFLPQVWGSIQEWDIFTFSQEWPVAVCVRAEQQHHNCTVPKNVLGWSVHGLWPTEKGKDSPAYCNNSWPFDVNVIKTLIPQMEIEWPNMFTDTSSLSFWAHEWTKHGTCATSIAATANEFLYFSQTLKLKSIYDMFHILASQGILPSNRTSYMLNETEAALKRKLEVNTVLECAYDPKTKRQLIWELEICLDQKFIPVDCYPDEGYSDNAGKRYYQLHKYKSKPQSSCPKHEGFYYLPNPNTNDNGINVKTLK